MIEAATESPVSRPWTWRRILGWVTVAVYAMLGVFLARAMTADAFWYGWNDQSFWVNVGSTFAYLIPAFVPLLLGLVAMRWPRFELVLHLALAATVVVLGWIGDLLLVALLVSAALVAAGLIWFVGDFSPRRWAVTALVGLPILTIVTHATGPVIRVATRIEGGESGARLVVGNGVSLVWAPFGPGWPDEHYGIPWSESLGICRYLSEDGRRLGVDLLDVWRLPTVDDVVRSMALHGTNSGGRWDATRGAAEYELNPDKEPPLWHVRSEVHRWWTETEADDARAYTVWADGRVEPRGKNLTNTGVAYRCVRDPEPFEENLATREEIDIQKLAYYGFSWGGRMGPIVLAMEPRLKVGIMESGALSLRDARPEAHQAHFAPRVTVPLLMLNGEWDFLEPVETAQKPLFELFGTPTEDKEHAVFDAGHSPLPRNQVMQATVAWLDKYLGPVR